LHYVNVPAPYSAFKHIRKLQPAEYMLVSRKGLTIDRYWRPRYYPTILIKSPREAVYELNRCLDETVKIMCRSDVPLGAMLSGGLDSSAVVTAMRQEHGRVDTFCVSHDIHGNDPEFEAARKVAAKYGTRHLELTFHHNQLATARDVVRSFSEPVASFVPLHAHALAALIRKHVKVALTGSGGDELFGGYHDHRTFCKLDKKSYIWKQLDKYGLGRLAEVLPVKGIRRSKRKYMGLRGIPLNQIAAQLRLRHAATFSDMVYSDKMKFMVDGCDSSELLVENFDSYGASTILDGYLIQQLMVISQHGIVDIPDTAGMANSLEYRSPI
jgi:asparagine synthase (glutamine-hydrolysing)